MTGKQDCKGREDVLKGSGHCENATEAGAGCGGCAFGRKSVGAADREAPYRNHPSIDGTGVPMQKVLEGGARKG